MNVRFKITLAALLAAAGCEGTETTVTPSSVPPTGPMASPTPTPTPSPGAKTVMVMVGPNESLSFSPQTITINAGDTVEWHWQSAVIPHTVTSGSPGAADGKFCSLPPGTTVNAAACNSASYARTAPYTYSNMFPTAGMFPYFCEVHGAAMTGMVIVNAAASPSPSPNPSPTPNPSPNPAPSPTPTPSPTPVPPPKPY